MGSTNWRQNILFVSLLAVAGGLIVLFFGKMGHMRRRRLSSTGSRLLLCQHRGVRLASFGYFGHMWGTLRDVGLGSGMIRASLAVSNTSQVSTEVAHFW